MADKIDILIERIAAKLAERRLSEREASLDATGKPDALRYIRVRRAMPSGERLAAIAKTLNTTPQWLLGGVEEGIAPDQHDDADSKLGAITQRRLPKTLPVYGTALAADIEFSTSEGAPIAVEQIEVNFAEPSDHMARPTSIAGKDGYYVVTVWGHSMEPRYDSGRRQLAYAHRPARAGEDVVVQLRSPIDDGEMVTAVLIKQLVRIKAGFVVLRQFNPAVEFEVPQHKVKHIHPIIPWDDVLGF
ncbi:S24 family peptidase [Sphingomonas adhaesiva]|uniref:S24 family peptidase n=1 Tax=Sphingomonas adhaesiva TaxID=28212 RepID=UPI002FF747E9